MDNTKFLKTVIILLLFINIGILAFIWINKPPHHGPPPHREIGDFLMQELNFTSEQRNQFEAMRDEHRTSVKELRNKNIELHDSFYDLLGNNATDTILMNQLADSIVLVQKQIEVSMFHHFQQVRKNCSPEQRIKFDKIIKEGMKMMAPNPPRK